MPILFKLNVYSKNNESIFQEPSKIINFDKFYAGKNIKFIIPPKILIDHGLKNPLYIVAHGFEDSNKIYAPDISKQRLLTVPEFMRYFLYEMLKPSPLAIF
ncbi:hypothetical protein [Fluviispira multicolorata]|uniref:Uncharacterized protein n=1 Tax=Fluviispira multicolorata TaxID=2654512 RepID=A0A833JFW4_9BACT|nr:hypothetical protein [Fluviispira multicolorata]KAB8031872.1 hypothetical protein GCL57_04305 [Fluviispira multicolorata]